MKCGPDGCPIVAFSDLTPAEQRVRRAHKAKEMWNRGFTERQIAKHFGVSQPTINSDLVDLSETDQSKKQAKTTTNPRGSGRTRGSRNGSGNRMMTKAMLAEAAKKALRDTEAKLTTARMQTIMFENVCQLLEVMTPRTRLKVRHHMEEKYGNDK